MLLEFVIMLWISALIFTILSFYWRAQLMFPIFAFLFWIATAYSMVQVDFVGFGSQNVITYNLELGDKYGDTQVFRLLGGLGLIMIIYAFYNLLVMGREDIQNLDKRDTLLERSRGWKGDG